jgi:hypothetical protein
VRLQVAGVEYLVDGRNRISRSIRQFSHAPTGAPVNRRRTGKGYNFKPLLLCNDLRTATARLVGETFESVSTKALSPFETGVDAQAGALGNSLQRKPLGSEEHNSRSDGQALLGGAGRMPPKAAR